MSLLIGDVRWMECECDCNTFMFKKSVDGDDLVWAFCENCNIQTMLKILED